MSFLLRRLERVLAIVGACFVVYHSGFRLDRLVSGSMQPTLMGHAADGDYVLSETFSGRWRRLQRFEVAAFRNQDGIQIMKRVAGLPGESVALRDGHVVVNGSPASWPAGIPERTYFAFGKLMHDAAVSCGDGYFVLGDDSIDSQDSRWEGPVAPGQIVGRAWLIVWPLSRAGWVR